MEIKNIDQVRTGQKVHIQGMKNNGADYDRILKVSRTIKTNFNSNLIILDNGTDSGLCLDIDTGRLTGKKARSVALDVWLETV